VISLKFGDAVSVRIHGGKASKRTRNRVKENGPKFMFEAHGQMKFDGSVEPAVLFKSLSTKWVGWLPAEEIIVSRA